MAEVDSLEIRIASDAKIANQAIKSIIDNLGNLSKALNIDTSKLANIGKAINTNGITSAAKNMQSQAQKISKSLSQITEQYKDLGKGFEIKGSTSQIQKQIDSLTNQLAKAKLAKEDFETSEKTNLGGYETAVKNVIKYTNQIESLKNQLAEIQSVKPTVDFKINGMETAKSQISDISEKLRTVSIPQSAFNYNADAMKAVFGEAAAGIENWTQATKIFGENAGDALNKASISTDELKLRTEQFEQSLKNLKIPPINTENISVLQRELAKAEAEVEKLRVKLANGITMGRISANVDDKGFRNLQEQIALAEKKAEALRQKIKEVGDTSGKENVGNLGKGLSDLSTNGAKAGSALNKASNSILNLSSRASSALNPINKMSNSFKGLFRTLLPIIGIRQLFNWGKQSIDIASDLTEVQNVVDTTFGNMAYKVEDFAQTSIEKFGISELALKQYSSRFQAMGTAMGFPIDKMSDMSIGLTKLTADMASFYNVEQDVVAEKLASVFTGQTRPLRDFGLDLTQATLQEWALKNGMDANIQSMSQAEKTMLRYQYVMANTGAAQGDFARTGNTWANQVRILKQNFQQLASVVGGVLVNAFKPIVKAVNSAMSAIIAFAKTISNALGKIFGWTYEEGGGGLAGDFEAAEDAAGGIADSTGTAANNIKKMKAGLRAFDELKTISMPDSGGGGGVGAGGSGDGGQWVKGESILKGFESDIETLEELGATISTTIANALKGIDWDEVYKKAEKFGSGLASFMNGLFAGDAGKELFKELGGAIAGAINAALLAVKSWSDLLKWEEIGGNIGESVNSFFKKWDPKLTAETFNSLANGMLSAMIKAVETIKWKKIAKKIATLIGEVDASGISWKLGKLVNSLANAFYQLVSNKETWKNLGTKIADGINGFIKGMGEVNKETGLTGWEALAEDLNSLVDGIKETLQTAIEGITWDDIIKGTKDFLGTLEIDTIAVSIGAFALKFGILNLTGSLLKRLILTKIGGIFSSAFGSSAVSGLGSYVIPISATIAVAIASVTIGKDSIEEGRKKIQEAVEKGDFAKYAEETAKQLINPFEWINQIGGGAIESLETPEERKNRLDSMVDEEAVKDIQVNVKTFFETKKKDVEEWWKEIEKWWGERFLTAKSKIEDFKKKVKNKWDEVSRYWKEKKPLEKIKTTYENFKEKVKNKWDEVSRYWKERKPLEEIKGKYENFKEKIKEKWTEAKTWWNGKPKLNDVSVKVSSIKSAVSKKWEEFRTWWNNLNISFPKIKVPHFKITWDTKNILGKEFKYPKGFDVQYYASGGFPEDGWFRASHGEIMGKFDNGQSVVANNRQITEGISLAVKSGNQESNSLMRQEISLLQRQNEILMGILQKEFGISKSDIGKAARDYSRDYFQRTGKPAYDF